MSQHQGNRRSPQRGRGVEFADYRTYDPGDDIRLVDWNVYLRLGIALVKQFTEERSLTLRVCVDTSESMAFGTPKRKADQAAEIAAALSMVALGQREPVTLVCAGGSAKAARARAVNVDAMTDLVTLLERTEPGGRGDIRKQIVAQLGVARSDRLVLLSDLLVEDAERTDLLRACAASCHAMTVIHVLGPEELAPVLDDVTRVIDAETGEEIVIPGGAKKEYQKALDGWLGTIEAECKRLGIGYLRVPTAETIENVLLRGLYRGRVVEHRIGATP
jgi:uncharacterized protein (DUF58 family)